MSNFFVFLAIPLDKKHTSHIKHQKFENASTVMKTPKFANFCLMAFSRLSSTARKFQPTQAFLQTVLRWLWLMVLEMFETTFAYFLSQRSAFVSSISKK